MAKKTLPKVKKIKPPAMTDNECMLRLGVPDGLISSVGEHRYGIVQDAVKGPQTPHNRKAMKKGRCY